MYKIEAREIRNVEKNKKPCSKTCLPQMQKGRSPETLQNQPNVAIPPFFFLSSYRVCMRASFFV